MAGLRANSNGELNDVDSGGYYWSSTIDGGYSHFLYFSSGDANMDSYYRAYGSTVRCIKD